jgi:uncharacterized protein YacL
MKNEFIVSIFIGIGSIVGLVITNLDELTEPKIFIQIIITFIMSSVLSFLLLHFYLKKVKKQ